MNRRDLIKSLALLPVVEMVKAEKSKPMKIEACKPEWELLAEYQPVDSEWPYIVGVKETPWLVGKINVFCNGMQMRCLRACQSEGWCEVYAGVASDRKTLRIETWRGDIEIKWKRELLTFEAQRSGVA